MANHNEKFFNIGYWLTGILLIIYSLPGGWLFILTTAIYFYARFSKDGVTK